MNLLYRFINNNQKPFMTALCCLLLTCCVASVRAQIGGLDIFIGGIDVFKPRNPAVKKQGITSANSGNHSRKNTKLSLEEIETKFEAALEAGNIARDERRYADAEKSYRAGIVIKPKDSRAHYGLGNVFADQQRWEEAERAYRSAYINDMQNADINTALSFVLVQQKSGANLAAKWVEAEIAARRAIAIEPNNAVAYDRLGVALEARGIYGNETEEAFVKSTELDPDFALAHAHLARIQSRKGRRSDSDISFKRAIELAQDAPTMTLIAEAYQADQRFNDSEPVLMRALQMDEKYPPALFLLGRVHITSSKFNEAESVLKSYMASSPRTFAAHYMLGSIYQRTDRLKEAENAYNRAAELANSTDKKQLAGQYGYTGIGDGYIRAERAKDALRVYQKAQNLDPQNNEIKNRIAEARTRNQQRSDAKK